MARNFLHSQNKKEPVREVEEVPNVCQGKGGDVIHGAMNKNIELLHKLHAGQLGGNCGQTKMPKFFGTVSLGRNHQCFISLAGYGKKEKETPTETPRENTALTTYPHTKAVGEERNKRGKGAMNENSTLSHSPMIY